MIVAAAVIIAATVVALTVWRTRSVDALITAQVRRLVVIELRSGDTFKGLLVKVDARSLLLRDVVAIVSAEASTVPVDGELVVPRADVKWLQRP